MQTFFAILTQALAIYGFITLVKQFKLVALIAYIGIIAGYITVVTMLVMGDKLSVMDWIFFVWMTLAIIHDLFSLKSWNTMAVVDMEREYKNNKILNDTAELIDYVQVLKEIQSDNYRWGNFRGGIDYGKSFDKFKND